MKPTVLLDTETFSNYHLTQFMNVETGNVRAFELFHGKQFDADTVRKILQTHRIISYNGWHYDAVILALALSGADNATIKRASDAIIKTGLKSWYIEKQFGVTIPKNIDHIDLIEVAPGLVKVSLKTFGGRMHSRRLQDLPLDVDAPVADADRARLREYCENDLITTGDLYRNLAPQIALRETMSSEYGIDLRSKSDAQIAETVIRAQVSKLLHHGFTRQEIPTGTRFRYKAPEFIQFKTPELQNLLASIRKSVFVVADSGKVLEPDALKAKVKVGGGTYRLGIGGLHSSEKQTAHVADDNTVLIDRDVASYYPSIILTAGLAPENMGEAFLKVYRGIVERRLEAKHTGDKVTADSLKITVNGSFGKFGSKWSILYSPNLLIQVTVTGQLALLMLIEMLELAGIPVVSANTDGVVIACPKARLSKMEDVVAAWEMVTGFETEEARYKALYSRDVNSYIALKEDGGVKLKGAYAIGGLSKNPSSDISTRAAIDYLSTGKPIEETVMGCKDIKQFVAIRNVRGGAIDQQGNYLGRVVRWYYSTEVDGTITYKVNGYKVPTSDGARPCMELPDELPEDIDYLKYIDMAYEILEEVGAQ